MPRGFLLAGFLTALALLSAVEWFGWTHIHRMQEAEKLVARTHEVQAGLNRLLLLLADLETGARGYVLTGVPAFLQPYENALDAIADQQLELERLVIDPEQQSNLSALQPLIAAKIRVAQHLVELRQSSGWEAAWNQTVLVDGKAAMDRIRAHLAQMERIERALLNQRSAASAEEANHVRILTTSGTGLSVLVLAVVFLVTLRENRLRARSEIQRDRFFTLSLDLMCVAGLDGRFKQLNPAFREMLGYTTEEMLARPFLEFVHPDDRRETVAQMQAMSDGRPLPHFETRCLCKDGSWKWLSWKCQPFPEEGLLYATARDVTEQKKVMTAIQELNAELQRRAALLEKANQELESFSYSVSHDLRAPLRHVQGYAQLLVQTARGQLSDKAHRYLHTIEEASVEMGQLIDELLAFSRMGRTEMMEQEVDLERLIAEIRRNLEPENQGRRVEWRVGPLPKILGDPALLRQVFVNLLSNAVKYTRGRDPAVIEVGADPNTNGEIILFVRDNGAGFDMKYAHKLFGVFQRLHRADEFEGTGIGLATVRRIIARHGGRTWAEGALNQGATLYLTLKPALGAASPLSLAEPTP